MLDSQCLDVSREKFEADRHYRGIKVLKPTLLQDNGRAPCYSLLAENNLGVRVGLKEDSSHKRRLRRSLFMTTSRIHTGFKTSSMIFLASWSCSAVPLKWAWLPALMVIWTPLWSLISCSLRPLVPMTSPTFSVGISITSSWSVLNAATDLSYQLGSFLDRRLRLPLREDAISAKANKLWYIITSQNKSPLITK